jgi:putative PIN family toxin of toxin-antitoxin system
MRVVLDTNIFISMTLGGYVGKINDFWKSGEFTLVVSDVIVSEYLTVLQRPKFHLSADTILAILSRVQRKAEFITPAESIQWVDADPNDDRFLEAGVTGRADYIVSGDRHLLELKNFRGIEILTAKEFIGRLGKE